MELSRMFKKSGHAESPVKHTNHANKATLIGSLDSFCAIICFEKNSVSAFLGKDSQAEPQ
jgi:hypothetical protein